MDEANNVNKELKRIKDLIKYTDNNLYEMKKLFDHIEKETRIDFREIEGDTGIFNGSHLVAEDGAKHEVPENYAAKSMLVYGDELKVIETEEGKRVFKQIEKVEREQVKGIANKKEGRWVVLTDGGSYDILEAAASYQKVKSGDELSILIPKENKKAPFGTLEKVFKDGQDDKEKPEPEKKKESETKKPVKVKDPVVKKNKPSKKEKESTAAKNPPKKETDAKKSTKTLEDDDLR